MCAEVNGKPNMAGRKANEACGPTKLMEKLLTEYRADETRVWK